MKSQIYKFSKCISKNFGTKKGYLKYLYYQLIFRLGKYSSFKNIDFNKVDRIIFVCKGNICRSAFADQMARSLGLNAISCGINAIKDGKANETAIKIAWEKGIDLCVHKTTPLSEVKPQHGDLYICMEPNQIKVVRSYANESGAYTLLGLWGDHKRAFLQDPYGLSIDYYRKCFELIEYSVNEIRKKLQ